MAWPAADSGSSRWGSEVAELFEGISEPLESSLTGSRTVVEIS